MKIWQRCVCVVFIGAICIFPQWALSKSQKKSKSPQSIQSEAGLKIPEYGIAIDAYYLPALDQLIPGYRILNVLVQNNRPEPIDLDVAKDKWQIVDHMGQKHKAFNHIKFFEKNLWEKMSDKAKSKLNYPNLVPSGKMVAIDVFFPNSVELNNFQEIRWDSAFFDKEFNVFTAYERQLKIEYDTTKVLDMPKSDSEIQNDKAQQDAYLQARDEFMGNHEKDVQKVFYIAPDGTMQEVDEPKLQENNLPVDTAPVSTPTTEQPTTP